jgi:uncharacterized protein involved in exopolysaccharide biosynthesis
MSIPAGGNPDRLDVFAMTSAIWRQKVIVLCTIFLFVSAAVAYSLSAQETFRAEAVTSPVERKASIGNLGQLASLAGINLMQSGDSVDPVAVLQSRNLSMEFIREKELLPILLAEIGSEDGSPGDSKKSGSGRLDERDALEFFVNDVRSIREDSKTGLVSVSVEWKDPVVAARWAGEIVNFVNERMRLSATAESQRNVDYLKAEIQAAKFPPIQQALSKLLESEMQKLLVARGSSEFAFRMIDAPMAPKYKSSPKRTLICLAGLFAGLFVGTLLALLREGWQRRRAQ